MTPAKSLTPRRILCAGILALAFDVTATAQDSAPAVPDAESIRSSREVVEADTGLPEELKTRALQYYDRAAEALENAERKTAELVELNAIIASAPARIPSLRDRLSESPAAEQDDISPGTSSDKVQVLVAQREADLIAAREVLENSEKAYRKTLGDGEDHSARLVESERRLRTIETDLRAPPMADEAKAVSDARQTYLAALSAYQRADIALLRTGLSNHELLVDLVSLERDAATADVKRIQAELEQL